jgi:hypothetical protein
MKLIGKILLILLAVAILFACIPYVITPIYDFPAKQKFSGDKFYNPYENIKSGKWLKANFHAHSNAWWGFTDGRENIASEMKERYKSLDYDIFSISDYMKINSLFGGENIFVPVYEHGYGFTKNHQLVIGAKNVDWLDYLFLQTMSDKQYTLNEIKKDDNIIVLNHPHLRDSYSSEDVRKLTGYNYIEIVNQNHGTALDLWDDALSSGSLIFGITGEDSHNSKNYIDMGKCFNLIYADNASEQGVLTALKMGRIIAVDLVSGNGNFNTLKTRSNELVIPEVCKMLNGTICIKLGSPVKDIEFIGQDGKHMKSFGDTDSASYSFLPGDTYIRTEMTLNNGSKIYLNPVIRYNGNNFPLYSAVVNNSATFLFRGLIILILASIILTVYLIRRKSKKIVPDVQTAEL